MAALPGFSVGGATMESGGAVDAVIGTAHFGYGRSYQLDLRTVGG